MDNHIASVGRRAPDFDLPCTQGGPESRGRVRLGHYADRWLVMVFFPRAYSLVCPTELTALSLRMDKFLERGCDVLGVSTDDLETLERWIGSPASESGLDGLAFPLASDADGVASRAFGVYLERQRIALRGLFIIDPNGVLQYQVVHNLSVGRRVDEVLRVLAALESGGMCPENWCSARPTLDPTEVLRSGSILGHYHVEEKVGEGSFASVFRARDALLDRTVALKVFKPDSLTSPAAFLAEARTAAALNHPNVCTVFSVDTSEGIPLIAMEYVDGQSLQALLNGQPLSPERVVQITRQIANALAAAHAQGIVHGDLKPANVLVTHDGRIKITDFGLSRRHTSRPLAETATWDAKSTGSLAGTPRYMSPEQVRGDTATVASDVFSLGAVVFEMLTGRQAFDGDNLLRVLDQIQRVDPVQYSAGTPEPFATILPRMLARDHHDRLVTMDQIAELLA